MIRRVWAVMKREWLENLRQPWLLVTMSSLLGIIVVGVLVLLYVLEGYAGDPAEQARLAYWARVAGVGGDDLLNQLSGVCVSSLNYLEMMELLGMTAVLAGHAIIHDRQCGTLPFLLLAPLRRGEWLAGKVLGALLFPLLFYVIFGSGASMFTWSLEVAAPHRPWLPPSPGWIIAFFIGGPVWSLVVGAMCVIISALSRDVRTSQQGAWFLVFFATMTITPMLVTLMPMGAVAELIFAALGLLLFGASLGVASLLISRDLGR